MAKGERMRTKVDQNDEGLPQVGSAEWLAMVAGMLRKCAREKETPQDREAAGRVAKQLDGKLSTVG